MRSHKSEVNSRSHTLSPSIFLSYTISRVEARVFISTIVEFSHVHSILHSLEKCLRIFKRCVFSSFTLRSSFAYLRKIHWICFHLLSFFRCSGFCKLWNVMRENMKLHRIASKKANKQQQKRHTSALLNKCITNRDLSYYMAVVHMVRWDAGA